MIGDATTIHLESPTIFDKMLSFGLGGRAPPSPEKTEATHRFYLCKKDYTNEEMGGKAQKYECKLENLYKINELSILYGSRASVQSIARGCPEWNDRLILMHRFQGDVIISKK